MWAGDLFLRYAFAAVSMLMVTVSTFFAERYVFRDGFAWTSWRWGKPKHYPGVIGLVLLLWVVPTLIALPMGISVPASLTKQAIPLPITCRS